MNIIQLVPHLPPLATGIGDYSLKIAQKLWENQDIFTYFITYELWFSKYVKEQSYIDQFPVKRLQNHNSDHLLSLIPEKFEAIILHYNFVERQETALWLLKNLQIARNKQDFKLVVMFHELTTTFKRKGINLPAPKHIISCLSTGMVADSIIVNNSISQTYLSKWLRRRVFCLPNFSNVGEPSHVSSLSERKHILIVFGSKSRASVYRNFCQELSVCCKILEIEKIYDIGPSCGLSFSNLLQTPIVEMGVQTEEVISELMSTSLAGFIDYSHSLGKLGKSTIFAAYSSHGLLPISSVNNCSQSDGLEVNRHYVLANKKLQDLNFKKLEEIANNAYNWYGNHSLDSVAQIFASCLRDKA